LSGVTFSTTRNRQEPQAPLQLLAEAEGDPQDIETPLVPTDEVPEGRRVFSERSTTRPSESLLIRTDRLGTSLIRHKRPPPAQFGASSLRWIVASPDQHESGPAGFIHYG
jgi:hypothetical protein